MCSGSEALDKIFPGTRDQRCWFQRTANILNTFPKSLQPAQTSDLPEIHHAETRAEVASENVFTTVCHRRVRTKSAVSQKTAKLMVFKLIEAASKTSRRLKGANNLHHQGCHICQWRRHGGDTESRAA